MKCWEEHFATHLNTQFPRDNSVLQSIPDPPPAEAVSEPFSIVEVEKAIQSLKHNKACGTCMDKISAETLKAGGEPMRQMLLKIINVAWSEGNTPQDWSRRSYHPSVQEGRQTRPKQLQSHHPTLYSWESLLQDDSQ